MTYEDDGFFQYLQNPWNLLSKIMDSFLQKHCVYWKVIPIVAAYTYFLFWYVLADVQWILWRQMLEDYLIIIALPLCLAVFSETINGIYEYSLYESQTLENDVDAVTKDVYLSVWDEIQYYKFLDKKLLRPCHFGGDETRILKELKKYVGDKGPEIVPE